MTDFNKNFQKFLLKENEESDNIELNESPNSKLSFSQVNIIKNK